VKLVLAKKIMLKKPKGMTVQRKVISSWTVARPVIRIDNLKFQCFKIREVNHEPFSRGGPCWVDDRCGGVNVGVGISMPGPQFQWSIDLGLRHLFSQGLEICGAPLSCCGRDRLPYCLLSVRPFAAFTVGEPVGDGLTPRA
jgi:hypothetical protein